MLKNNQQTPNQEATQQVEQAAPIGQNADPGHFENFEYKDYDAYSVEEDPTPADFDGFTS